MSTELRKMREKLGRTWEEYKTFRDSLPNDEDMWTAGQQGRFKKFDADIDRFESEIDRLEKDESREYRFGQDQDDDDLGDVEDRQGGYKSPSEKAFRSYLAHGLTKMGDAEKRDLQMDSDTAGGFAVVPQNIVKQIIMQKDDELFARKYATKFQVPKAESMAAPELDPDASDAEWTSELLTGTVDSVMGFKKRALFPHPLVKKIKVSNKLRRASYLNFGDFILGRLRAKIGSAEENSFLTGDGAQSPLGIFAASDQGVSTGRDMSTDNTTTTIKADNLMNCSGHMKAQYLKNARWLFHRDAITKIRKLKDGDGDYLWRVGLMEGKPNTLLGLPIDVSEYAPNTFTTGLYVGALIDWSSYWIVDALSMEVQVVDQLYAETNQTLYIVRSETDGCCVDEQGVTRVTLA